MTTLFSDKNIVPVTELEQSAFCQTEGNLRTKTLEEEFSSGVRWQKIPTRYLKLTPDEIDKGIKDQVKKSVEFSEKSPYPEKDDAFSDVYVQTDYPFLKE